MENGTIGGSMKLGWFGLGMGAFADPESVADLAVAAEAFGYESVWLGEHPVLVDPQQRPSPLPPHSELLDPIAVLAYAAARTTTLRLATGIVLLPLRNPVTLAKELASIDVLSRGRLILGIGVGYVNGEYDALGVEFTTRGRRADESLDALRVLWTEERPEMHGAFVDFAGIQCRPRPVQPGGPPILGSGMSTAARRRTVAKCHGFLLDLDATQAAVHELSRLAEEVERPDDLGPLEITITPPSGRLDSDMVARYEDLGVHRLVLVHDLMHLAGGPDRMARQSFLSDMEATAGRLGLP
jgi:probable F420-dependent oxidoreductase